MFSPISRALPRWSSSVSEGSDIPSYDASSPFFVCDLEGANDKRTRLLRHLIKLNHSEYALTRRETDELNTIPEALIAAYGLDLDLPRIEAVLDETVLSLAEWQDSPGEISEQDWKDNLGNPSYQRAYFDFFGDLIVENAYNWRAILQSYLFQQGGLFFRRSFNQSAAPLNRLASAICTNSRELATEALALYAIAGESEILFNTRSVVSAKDEPSMGALAILEWARVKRQPAWTSKENRVGILSRLPSLSLDSPTKQVDELQLILAALICTKPQDLDQSIGLICAGNSIRVVHQILSAEQLNDTIKQLFGRVLDLYMSMGYPLLSPRLLSQFQIFQEPSTATGEQFATQKLENAQLLTTLYALQIAQTSSSQPQAFREAAEQISKNLGKPS